MSCTSGQRVWKLHPGGTRVGLSRYLPPGALGPIWSPDRLKQQCQSAFELRGPRVDAQPTSGSFGRSAGQYCLDPTEPIKLENALAIQPALIVRPQWSTRIGSFKNREIIIFANLTWIGRRGVILRCALRDR